MKKMLWVAAALAVLAGCKQDLPIAPDQMVDLGTHKLYAHVEGKGTPVVVLEAGLGDGSDQLRPLQKRLAAYTRVVSYDRAGYGQSEPGPLPRDFAREAAELKAVLDKASIPGPYVLVGHSLGAENLQLFAAKYPEDVAAMVLMDPPPATFIRGQEWSEYQAMAEGMTAEWQAGADAGEGASDPRQRAQAAFLGMLASEHREMFGEGGRQATAITSFGDVPLVVMASGKANPALGENAEAFQKYWIEQSRALAAKSTRGKLVLAESSSHYIYRDAPDLVEQAVLEVLKEARGK